MVMVMRMMVKLNHQNFYCKNQSIIASDQITSESSRLYDSAKFSIKYWLQCLDRCRKLGWGLGPGFTLLTLSCGRSIVMFCHQRQRTEILKSMKYQEVRMIPISTDQIILIIVVLAGSTIKYISVLHQPKPTTEQWRARCVCRIRTETDNCL